MSEDPRVSDEATGLPPLENVDPDDTLLVCTWVGSVGIAMTPGGDDTIAVQAAARDRRQSPSNCPPEARAAAEEKIGDAIQATVAEHERGFVTKWVALVESVDPDGQRGLWTMTSGDVKAWDTVGLLQHGLHLQLAQTLDARREE